MKWLTKISDWEKLWEIKFRFDIDERKEFEKETQYRNYWAEILSTMTNSDIMWMIVEKRKELKLYPTTYEWYQSTHWIDTINSLINKFSFELRQRDPETRDDRNTKEFLEQKKKEVSIVNVIQSITWKTIVQWPKHNIKCIMPDHKDKTASMHIYEHTNWWYCFWCHHGWTQVDLIKEHNKCSTGEAIKLFLNSF